MAGWWVKSLQCKSRAFDDIYHPNPKRIVPATASCRKSANDVVRSTVKQRPRKPKSPPPPPNHSRPSTTNPDSRPARVPDQSLPALTELPLGHPSRNVVEIIFHTSWSPGDFSGRIEMILKVHNGSRTVGRFEEYRELVKAQARSGGGCNWEENARCAADGNEVMRFHCLGDTSCGGGGSWAYDACGGAWTVPGGKGASICTFSGSGEAHENAGGGRGRRSVLVCRVIAGRVSTRIGSDSVSGDNGELLVFDSRAVLPCFLIIYRL